jgi:ABC-type dipeptide/oligopeptide/nickel transport system permease component
MKYNLALKNKNVLLWESQFLNYVKKLKTTHVSFTYSTSGSLEDEIEANIGFDSKLVTITFLLITIFAIIFMSFHSNKVTSPGIVLPSTGIFSAVLGVSSSTGFLSLIGYSACNLIAPIPFLVMG